MTGIIFFILRIILAIALYAFVGWIFFTLWKELQSQSQAVQTRPSPEITLTCDELDNLSQSFTLNEITIGRDPNCDFILSDDTISAHHARISYHHNQWWVEDLNSTNGVILNEEKLYTATVVIGGDEIGLGRVHIQILIKKEIPG